jgi:endonuclease-3
MFREQILGLIFVQFHWRKEEHTTWLRHTLFVNWGPKRIRSLVETLEKDYGRPKYARRFEPLDELVSCILSQHTTDATSFPTFARLREKYQTWEQIASLSQSKLEEEIRPAGLPKQKAKSILLSLEEIRRRNGSYTLDPLTRQDMESARTWLQSLPGVGPKTAAIVLAFAFGMPAIPVDTHVFRVSWRLGIIEQRIGEARAHRALQTKVPEDLAYRFHVALIRHGRQTCKALRPACERCSVRSVCAYFKQLVREAKVN